MTRKRRIIIAATSFTGLVLWLLLTNPRNLPIALLMVPVVLLFVGLLSTSGLLLEKLFPKMVRRRRIMLAVTISVVPAFLLVLGSINQLTWRDVILVAILVGFLYFYSGRLDFSES